MDDPKADKPPHATRCGYLKNGNKPGNLFHVARCGAQTRTGAACRSPAMANTRCRMHGGKATGARTMEGLQRCRTAPLKHGQRSAAVLTKRRQAIANVRRIRLETAALLKEVDVYIRTSRRVTTG